MSDFDYSGYGLFESLASDQQEERRAHRKALVTAQSRVEDNLGRFFAASKTPDEFDERYSLVQQEFVSTIREAAEEFGVREETIANTIFDHYRKAALKVADEKPKKDEEEPEPIEEPEESEDDEEFDKHNPETWHSESSVQEQNGPPLVRTADGGEKGTCSECENEGFLKGGVCGSCRGKKLHDTQDKETDASSGSDNANFHAKVAEDAAQAKRDFPADEEEERATAPGPTRKEVEEEEERLRSSSANEYASDDDENAVIKAQQEKRENDEAEEQEDRRKYRKDDERQAHLRWAAEGADDGDSYDKETVDLSNAKEDSNTGLGGPSPKIDKGPARKDGDVGNSLDEIDVPSKAHPTERIDATVVMPRENIKTTVKDQVKGIGEQTTESYDLPSASRDDGGGFAKNNMDSGPHTDTWGGKGQAEPVTSAFPLDPNQPEQFGQDPHRPRVDPAAPQQGQAPRSYDPQGTMLPDAQTCANCGGANGGCEFCHHTGLAPHGGPDNQPGATTFPAGWVPDSAGWTSNMRWAAVEAEYDAKAWQCEQCGAHNADTPYCRQCQAGQPALPGRSEWEPQQVGQPQNCPRCGGQGCGDCRGTGKVS